MDKYISVPLREEDICTLKAGDYVYLTGTIYTARDAAHKRMYEALGNEEGFSAVEKVSNEEHTNKESFSNEKFIPNGKSFPNGKFFPIEMQNNVIYYMGPSPAREGRPIGSAGPTTASRMDKYAPLLLDLGLKGMIGKGKRSKEVKNAIVRNGAIYFAAVGGAGALLSKSITSSEVIAYDDLGTEAIHKLTVKDFPVIVVIDSEGNDLYETAVAAYRQE